MAVSMESDEQSRISDLCDEPVDRYLTPIRGYETEPLVPLSDAIKPVSGIFNRIEDYVFIALHNCRNPSDDLTQHESASIYLYTMQFSGGPSLYLLLNQSLRAENREELKSWFFYLKLFLTALYKLPSQSRIVWRGVKNIDLSSIYKKGTKFVWWGVSSCTTDIEVLKSNTFLGKTGERTIFSIECINGKSISNHSYYKKKEDEIILMPGSYFEVIGQLDSGNQLHIIQLREISPPITSLEPPFPNLSNIISKSTQIKSRQQLFIPNLTANRKWKQQGTYSAGGHGRGDQLNQLSSPFGVFLDDDQTICVADTDNHRIVEWKSGAITGQIVAGGNGQGDQNDQLKYPRNVLIDQETDSLIICDQGNRRVVRWPRRNGRSGETIISNIDRCDLIMDNDGFLYACDYKKDEVRRWKMGEKNGTIVAGGNGKGDRLDQLSLPYYISVDEDQSVYVSDCQNNRVMKWVKGGKEGIVVAGGQGYGNGLRQLSYPRGIIVDQLGHVYVVDRNNHRVMRWLRGAAEGTIVVGGNGKGEQSNQFSYPEDLSFDRQNNLYVLDFGNNRVIKFDVDLH